MADVVLSVPVKDAYINLVSEAFSAYAEKRIGYSVKIITPPSPILRVDNFSFTYPVKGAGETTKQFGERVIKALVTGFVKCYKLGLDVERVKAETLAIVPATETVPEIIS